LDAARDRLAAAYADALAAGEIGAGALPGNWVFVGNFVNQRGEVDTVAVCSDGLGLDGALGLLALGRINWEEAARDWLRENRT
jgi:hypothetical protein